MLLLQQQQRLLSILKPTTTATTTATATFWHLHCKLTTDMTVTPFNFSANKDTKDTQKHRYGYPFAKAHTHTHTRDKVGDILTCPEHCQHWNSLHLFQLRLRQLGALLPPLLLLLLLHSEDRLLVPWCTVHTFGHVANLLHFTRLHFTPFRIAAPLLARTQGRATRTNRLNANDTSLTIVRLTDLNAHTWIHTYMHIHICIYTQHACQLSDA